MIKRKYKLPKLIKLKTIYHKPSIIDPVKDEEIKPFLPQYPCKTFKDLMNEVVSAITKTCS